MYITVQQVSLKKHKKFTRNIFWFLFVENRVTAVV